VIRIYQAANLAEAHLLAGMLRAAGLDVRVLNENAQGALGEIPFTHAWPEVWLLDERQRAAAERLIAAYEGSVEGAGCTCATCGEHNPAAFELCWQCGAPLDEACATEE
jgi:hypothetical protein